MELILSRAAQKAIKSMPRAEAANLMARLQAFADNPYGTNPSVKALVGVPGYRMRVGSYRAMFVIEGNAVHVTAIGDRKEIYR